MALIAEPLPTLRAADLHESKTQHDWLIHTLWAKAAVGVIGGAPKLGKSWLGLDMAVSVASGTPCLGRFQVHDKGPALIFLAEDPLNTVRARIASICEHRRVDVKNLDLFVINVPVLMLDLENDRLRLDATIEKFKPRILVLDPLVRMHSLDENSAHDIASLLGALSRFKRKHLCAIVLVHHASKRGAARPGETLRGSTDLHAWGDSNAYLVRRNEQTLLTIEHRAARTPEPIVLDLVSKPDGSATHLEVIDANDPQTSESIEDRICTALRNAKAPLRRTALRDMLRINNERLGNALTILERDRRIARVDSGWTIC